VYQNAQIIMNKEIFMKMLALLLMVLTSSTYAIDIIANNDIIKSNRFSLDLDGVELWDVAHQRREDVISEFTNKCLFEIPVRVLGHEPYLRDFYTNFNHKLHTKVIRVKHRNYGIQLICRATMKLDHDYGFVAKYSEIYEDQVNGTYQTCKKMVDVIDNSDSEEPMLLRRVYFSYANRRNGEAYFPKCQILKLLVLPRQSQKI
jgi:hypothetical protein